MTTDTAVRVTRLVVQGKSELLRAIPRHGVLLWVVANTVLAPLNEIEYLDHPELKFNEHESTQMPFRYVEGQDGKPVMPEVSAAAFHLHTRLSSSR